MTHDIADWQITVYALGELEGEDQSAVERAVAEDPELAARVEAIRRQAEDVAYTLAAEPLPEPRPRHRSSLGRRLAAVAALAAIFVIAWSATWGVQRPRPSSERSGRFAEERWLEAVLANQRVLDNTRVDLDFTDASLEDILGFIREYARINIEIDETVRQEGLAERKISFQMREAVLRNALSLLLRQYGLGMTVDDHGLLVVKQVRSQGAPVAMVHDVRDLLRPISDFCGPTISLATGEGEASEPTAAFELANERRSAVTGEELTRLLKEHIESTCPAGSSDQVSISLSPQGQLVVVNSPEVQREVQQFLGSLRRSAPSGSPGSPAAVALSDSDLVRWPSEEYWEQVRHRQPLSTLQEEQTSGTVVLHPNAAEGVFSSLVNNSGVIEARSLKSTGGVVRLRPSSLTWGRSSTEDMLGGRDFVDGDAGLAMGDLGSISMSAPIGAMSGYIDVTFVTTSNSDLLEMGESWSLDRLAIDSGTTFSGQGQALKMTLNRGIEGYDDMPHSLSDAIEGTAWRALTNNLLCGGSPGQSRSRCAIELTGDLPVTKVPIWRLSVDADGAASGDVGYCEGGETGAVTTTDVRGHAAQITISGGIGIDAVWRSDNLTAVLNREGAATGAVGAAQAGDDGDSVSFWSPMVRLSLDAYMSKHVTGVIELGPTPPSAPQAEFPMSFMMDYNPNPIIMALATITVPERGEARPPVESPGTEDYAPIVENPFMHVTEEALTTFSIDVDTASYANVRRFLHMGQLPPPDAVRIEELVNYFPYDYAPPTDDQPFAVHLEMAACPWNKGHRLLRVGLKGRVPQGERPASNLVFLVDVSGSMESSNKLPLVQAGLRLLVKEMSPRDRIAIVTYAGASGVALPSTPGNEKSRILEVLEGLRAGGSTNGASGVEVAYRLATEHFIQGGTNRVVLATDGDWNVGVTSHGDLVRLIEEKAKTGVFLTVLGFGMGNLKDDTLEGLADKGNGNYAYVDSLSEAEKVLVTEMGATLQTIAKDVKIQIEFNPARIAGYRLIGYENRLLAKQDFADDKKDAGEIGAGHTVTALYEVVPVGQEMPGQATPVPPLRYQTQGAGTAASNSTEACIVKLRYKAPDGDKSALIEVPLVDKSGAFDEASEDFRFATAVAGYGMLLRKSQHAKGLTWDGVLEIAQGSVGKDTQAYRAEFNELVRRAKDLSR